MNNSPNVEDVALFDLDGTLADYDFSLRKDLELIASPTEPPLTFPIRDESPKYIINRADLIRSSEEWWAKLPKLQLGWDILNVAKTLEYTIMILTQGPRSNPAAWSGKKKWVDENLPNEDITITRDKGLVYGKILVDDFPKYIERWLTWRKRGLVIMPENESNKSYQHPQVIHYNGKNIEEVREKMSEAKRRD